MDVTYPVRELREVVNNVRNGVVCIFWLPEKNNEEEWPF